MILGLSDYKDKYDFSGVTGVIHVGGHHGQEYEDYNNFFRKDLNIHWFEPISESFATMIQNIGLKQNNIFYNFALGSEKTWKKMWRDLQNNGQSSSFLKPSRHLEIFPHITFSETPDEIEIYRLDDLCIRDSNVLVMDTQGYELEILKGASETLPFIDHIFCEVNINNVYENCPDLQSINSFLENYGFHLKENWWTSNDWGDCYWNRNTN